MTGPQFTWLALALAGVLALALLGYSALRRRPAAPTPAGRSAWLVAATASGTMVVFIAAQMRDLIPHATVIDLGALAVTGILTGLFLGLGLMPSPGRGASR